MAEGLTQLLVRWSDGDRAALDELMPLVYDQLRRIARNHFRRERPGMTLEPTALVNEAYLRLVDQNAVKWQNRAHFYAISATIMREILVDHFRRRRAAKRGGDWGRISLSDADHEFVRAEIDMVELDEALKTLESQRPELCRIVEMRFFAGLTIEETAEALKLSHSTVERSWALAKAWLHRELSR